jgi:hypothetical protein
MTACGLAIWLGANITRLFLGYNLFWGTEFELNSRFAKPDNLAYVLPVLSPAFLTAAIAQVFYLVCFFCFIISSKLSLRMNGWLMISLILVLVSMPLDIYLWIKIDRPFIEMSYWGQVDGKYMLDLLIQRFKVLSSYPVISVFTNLSLVYFFIFQPLRKKNEN